MVFVKHIGDMGLVRSLDILSGSCYVHLIALGLCNQVDEFILMLWYFILVPLLYLKMWVFSFEHIDVSWERCCSYTLMGMTFCEKHVMISLWEIGCVFLGRYNEDPYTIVWKGSHVKLQCVYSHLTHSYCGSLLMRLFGYVVMGEIDSL